MKTIRMKQKLILSALAGAIMIPGSAFTVRAADTSTGRLPSLPVAGIESAVQECYQADVRDNMNLYLVQNSEGEYLNMAFSNVSDYTYIRSAPDETSDWNGKLYQNSAAEVLEYNGNEPSLHYISEWWKQLYGESEGKDQRGIFPASVDLTTDQLLNISSPISIDIFTL